MYAIISVGFPAAEQAGLDVLLATSPAVRVIVLSFEEFLGIESIGAFLPAVAVSVADRQQVAHD